jgi:hypothetical protein
VAAFQLEIKLTAAVFMRQFIVSDQRRIPLADGEQGGFRGNGEIFFVLLQNAFFQR